MKILFRGKNPKTNRNKLSSHEPPFVIDCKYEYIKTLAWYRTPDKVGKEANRNNCDANIQYWIRGCSTVLLTRQHQLNSLGT